MKAAISLGLGDSTRFELRDRERPKPRARELLVEVHASSVNPKDWKYVTVLNGLLSRLGLRPFVLGDDMAGVVVERGAAAIGFEVGDAVYGMSVLPKNGALAEFARLDARRAAHKPVNLTFSEAAGMPLAALTALQALRIAKVVSGQVVYETARVTRVDDVYATALLFADAVVVGSGSVTTSGVGRSSVSTVR